MTLTWETIFVTTQKFAMYIEAGQSFHTLKLINSLS